MTLSAYSRLKENIIFNVNTSERYGEIISAVKRLFQEDINSIRKYEGITSISRLLHVLEIRGVLDEGSVGALKVIARKLNNSNDILTKITEYEENYVPKDNGNYYASKTYAKKETGAQEIFVNNNPLGGNISDKKLQRIFETLYESIGTYWKDLGRCLNMQEGFIDELEIQNIPLHSKVTKLMDKYMNTKADPQRWFFVLCDALEQARRKDIAKSLQEIMVMNI